MNPQIYEKLNQLDVRYSELWKMVKRLESKFDTLQPAPSSDEIADNRRLVAINLAAQSSSSVDETIRYAILIEHFLKGGR